MLMMTVKWTLEDLPLWWLVPKEFRVLNWRSWSRSKNGSPGRSPRDSSDSPRETNKHTTGSCGIHRELSADVSNDSFISESGRLACESCGYGSGIVGDHASSSCGGMEAFVPPASNKPTFQSPRLVKLRQNKNIELIHDCCDDTNNNDSKNNECLSVIRGSKLEELSSATVSCDNCVINQHLYSKK